MELIAQMWTLEVYQLGQYNLTFACEAQIFVDVVKQFFERTLSSFPYVLTKDLPVVTFSLHISSSRTEPEGLDFQ